MHGPYTPIFDTQTPFGTRAGKPSSNTVIGMDKLKGGVLDRLYFALIKRILRSSVYIVKAEVARTAPPISPASIKMMKKTDFLVLSL